MAGKFSIETIFGFKDKITAPVKKLRQNIRNFTRSANRNFKKLNKTVGKFGATLKSMALRGVVSLGILSAGILNVIRVGAEFEQTLVNAAAKFPGEIRKGTKEFKALSDAAREAGATTEFSASQAAQGLDFLAMAGFNAKQAVAALPGVIDLATASGIELGEATDIASDSLGAFGLMSKDTATLTANLARINDVLAKTTTSANTDMTSLFETIKKGGPQATASGQSLETFAAFAGIMANNSLKASEAGSTLKNIFLRLSAPTAQASKLIKKYAGEVVDAKGNLIDTVDIIGKFEKGLKGLGNAQRAQVLNTIFGARAITGVNILLQEGSESIRAYRDELIGATGATKTMADVMRDTTQGRIKTMQSAFESLKITLFLLNNTALSGFIEKITEAIRRVDKMINLNKEFGRTLTDDVITIIVSAIKIFGILIGLYVSLKLIILGVNAALALQKIAIFGIIVAMKAWTVATKAWGIIMALAEIAMWAFNAALWANPIGVVIAAVVLLIAAFAAFVFFFDDIVDFFADVWDGLKSVFFDGVSFIVNLIDSITKPFKSLIGGVLRIKQAVSLDDTDIDIDEEVDKATTANSGVLITQSEQISKSFTERRDTIAIDINDKSGAASIVKMPSLGSAMVSLQSSGGF